MAKVTAISRSVAELITIVILGQLISQSRRRDVDSFLHGSGWSKWDFDCWIDGGPYSGHVRKGHLEKKRSNGFINQRTCHIRGQKQEQIGLLWWCNFESCRDIRFTCSERNKLKVSYSLQYLRTRKHCSKSAENAVMMTISGSVHIWTDGKFPESGKTIIHCHVEQNPRWGLAEILASQVTNQKGITADSYCTHSVKEQTSTNDKFPDFCCIGALKAIHTQYKLSRIQD